MYTNFKFIPLIFFNLICCFSIQNIKTEKREPTKIDLSRHHIAHRRNIQTEKDNNMVSNRLKLRKTIVNKTCMTPVDSYSWNSKE